MAGAAVLLTALLAPPASAQIPVTPQASFEAALTVRRAAARDSMAADALHRLELRSRWEAGDAAVPDSAVLGRAVRLTPLDAALLIASGAAPGEGNRLLRLEAEAPFRMGMFYLHDIMAALLFGGDAIEAATDAAVRESVRTLPLYRGDTENHWLLYHTGLLLAAERWPDEPGTRWFNGRSSAENAADARGWLDAWMEATVSHGQMEFDSPNYLTTFLAPLLTLHRFAADPVLRARAGGMLEWILADYAVESLDGLYVGGHSRDYPWHATAPATAPNIGWGWLYFGQGPMAWRSEYLPVAALSAWVPPAILRDVAHDRSAPYSHRERKRVRSALRYAAEQNPPVYKTTWMTADYALGSLHGGVLQPIQQHTWDVTFSGDGGAGALFFLHPYFSGRELATFFPEEPEWLTDQVNRFHTSYTDPDKWVSSSPYERVMQHEGALIALYDIPDTASHGHIDGWFPPTLDELDAAADGWIFARAGRAYVAVRPLRPGAWSEEPGGGRRLRSPHRRTGVVVQTGRLAEHGSFEVFKMAVRAAGLDVDLSDALRVRYRALSGDDLDFTFPDRRLLNGAPLRLEETPLFDGPFVRATPGRMVITHGGRTRVVEPLR